VTALLAVIVVVGLIFVVGGVEAREKQALILKLLRERGECYGLELVHASEGRLCRGTIYVHLHDLEERGLLRSRETASGRRVYALAPEPVA
jgi:DNA-binding PadR family transcriptional regulator